MSPPRRLLITGARGQLGWECVRAMAPLGSVAATDIDTLDLTDPGAIRRLLREWRPQIIINAAAYTAVDQAESEPAQAWAVNVAAPAVLAEEARRLDAVLVHYSTDYVFDGSGSTAWREQDDPAPLNVYGRSKWEGEQAVAASGARHLILRSSWLYGARGRNFPLTLRRLAREQRELRVVDDQIGAPTWCRHLAEASAQALAQVLSPRWAGPDAEAAPPWGVYHLCNGGETSWHGFAQALLDLEPRPEAARLIPIASCDHPGPAQRPLNSRLDTGKFSQVFGLALPDWRAALADCFEL